MLFSTLSINKDINDFHKLPLFDNKIAMKKYFCLLTIILVAVSVRSQDVANYSALLLDLDGQGNYVRGAKKSDLEIPQSYISGDKVIMKSGSAIIMLFSGDEIQVEQGAEIQIPGEGLAENQDVKNLVNAARSNHGLLAQTGAAYSLRGQNSALPAKSKILDTQKTFLKFDYGNADDMNISFKIIDSQTQKVIFEKDSVCDTLVSLAQVPFVKGKSYYWTISGTPDNRPGMGVLEFPGEEETSQLQKFDSMKSNLEYISAIGYYYDKGYFFEAYNLIQEAIKSFPEMDIYPVILDNLLSEY